MATGINNTKLEETMKSIMDQIENLNSVFNHLDEEFMTVKNEIEGDFQTKLVEKYTSINSQYKIIKENVKSYAIDLAKVKKTYENQDTELRDIVITNINKIEERRED